jgi:pimeloyl-ACP methyl ester carboxylesterase
VLPVRQERHWGASPLDSGADTWSVWRSWFNGLLRLLPRLHDWRRKPAKSEDALLLDAEFRILVSEFRYPPIGFYRCSVPVLVAHGTDDQIVPYADSAPLSVKLLKHGTLKSYDGLPHGMLSTHPEILNPDLLAFLKRVRAAVAAICGFVRRESNGQR